MTDVCGFGPMTKHQHKENFHQFKLDYTCTRCIDILYQDVLKLKMNFECFRRESFKHWGKESNLGKTAAEHGWYYLHQKDYIKCNFCNAYLSNWTELKSIKEHHRNSDPDCKMAWDLTTPNIPITKFPNNISKASFIKMSKEAVLDLLDESSTLIIYK